MSSAVLQSRPTLTRCSPTSTRKNQPPAERVAQTGYDKPLVGETTPDGRQGRELAGSAANGVRGHVGLTADAPMFRTSVPSSKNYKQTRSQRHQGLFFGIHAESCHRKGQSTDGKAVAAAMKNACFKVKGQPGILLDVC